MEIFCSFRNNKEYSTLEYLSLILDKYYGFTEPVEMLFNAWGKPSIKNSTLMFNCSHSFGLLACAIADFEIGIDVQRVSKRKNGIVNHYFTKNEIKFLSSTVSEPQNFTIIWTRKEAFGKWVGLGLTEEILSKCTVSMKNLRTFHFDDYYLSICCEGASRVDVNFNPVNFEAIFEEINVISI